MALTCSIGTTDCSAAMLGQTLTFAATSGGVSGIQTATLDFGDGSARVDLGALSAPRTVGHEYNRLGAFSSRLDVTMASGEIRSVTQSVKVYTVVGASLNATSIGGLNVVAVADVQGAAVDHYDWTFDPNGSPVSTTAPEALYTYPTPGYKAVDLRVYLTDGRVIRTSGHVVVE